MRSPVWWSGALLLSATSLWSATADDLLAAAVASVPADELTAGNPARANAIAALVDTPGLAAADHLALQAALAEAWLDALDPTKTCAVVTQILADPAVTDALRERAALSWVAAWQVRVLAAEKSLPDPLAAVVALDPAHPPSARVRARALAARAQASLARKEPAKEPPQEAPPSTALADLDAALALLATADAGERVPLYALRLTAMEATGASPDDVRTFLQTHRDDPAATIAAEAALTAVEKLAGQPAPPLKLKRLDGKLGDKPVELTLTNLLAGEPGKPGHPVLIDVFATWCKPCAQVAPAMTAIAKRWQPRGVRVLGVSLDTKDTVAALPAWIASHAIDYPIVGDGLGWDSEFAAAWHVDSIPRLILVDAQGVIVTADLGGATVEEVERNVDQVLARLLDPQAKEKPKATPATPAVDDQIP